jgi:hypothetical protein
MSEPRRREASDDPLVASWVGGGRGQAEAPAKVTVAAATAPTHATRRARSSSMAAALPVPAAPPALPPFRGLFTAQHFGPV